MANPFLHLDCIVGCNTPKLAATSSQRPQEIIESYEAVAARLDSSGDETPEESDGASANIVLNALNTTPINTIDAGAIETTAGSATSFDVAGTEHRPETSFSLFASQAPGDGDKELSADDANALQALSNEQANGSPANTAELVGVEESFAAEAAPVDLSREQGLREQGLREQGLREQGLREQGQAVAPEDGGILVTPAEPLVAGNDTPGTTVAAEPQPVATPANFNQSGQAVGTAVDDSTGTTDVVQGDREPEVSAPAGGVTRTDQIDRGQQPAPMAGTPGTMVNGTAEVTGSPSGLPTGAESEAESSIPEAAEDATQPPSPNDSPIESLEKQRPGLLTENEQAALPNNSAPKDSNIEAVAQQADASEHAKSDAADAMMTDLGDQDQMESARDTANTEQAADSAIDTDASNLVERFGGELDRSADTRSSQPQAPAIDEHSSGMATPAEAPYAPTQEAVAVDPQANADGAEELLMDPLNLDAFIEDNAPAESVRKTAEVLREAMLTSVRQDGKSVQIELHPAELGKLKIEVTQVDQSVEAQIIATESVTSELLNNHREQLIQTLNDLGFDASDVDISYDDQSSAGTERDQPPATFNYKSKSQTPQRIGDQPVSQNGVNIVA